MIPIILRGLNALAQDSIKLKESKKKFFPQSFKIIKFIIIIFFFFDIFIISNKNLFFSFIMKINDIKKLLKYIKFCNDYKYNEIKKFKNKQNPKVSIISPIFNSERYLFRFLRNIQYQNFEDIEIILVDDCSKDNTIKMIKEFQKKDKRLIILKNKKNKGTFISRNIGVQFSKAKYVIIPDPDDFISKNILNICYKYSKKYNYEIIRFQKYIGDYFNKIFEKLKKKNLNQPELSYNMFYLNNELEMTDLTIYNKFIKKEVYIKALNSLTNYYSNIYMILMEDQIMDFILYRTAKSFYFLKNFGYFHKATSISITKNDFKINKLKLIFVFIYLKFIFQYTKNVKYEKDMANLVFSKFYKDFKNNISILLSTLSNFNLFFEILNMYSNCKFILKENKQILINLKNIIIKNNNHSYIFILSSILYLLQSLPPL